MSKEYFHHMYLEVDAFTAELSGLTASERGVFVSLLTAMWINGPLPDDDRRLRQYACVDHPTQWRRVKDAVLARMIRRDGTVSHRLIEEMFVTAAKHAGKAKIMNQLRASKAGITTAGVTQTGVTQTGVTRNGPNPLKNHDVASRYRAQAQSQYLKEESAQSPASRRSLADGSRRDACENDKPLSDKAALAGLDGLRAEIVERTKQQIEAQPRLKSLRDEIATPRTPKSHLASPQDESGEMGESLSVSEELAGKFRAVSDTGGESVH